MGKPKKVNFELIEEPSEPYKLLEEVREMYHSDTIAARIGLAWRKRNKADQDGHLVLGRCVKVNDLTREFADYDFIIVLNREVWDDASFTTARKKALLDHEMCHAAPDIDENSGETKADERGRQLFRIRKHDIEEFRSVVAHHGCYKGDLEAFAKVLLNRKKSPLFGEQKETTVSFGVKDPETGEMKYTDPITTTELHERVDAFVKQ